MTVKDTVLARSHPRKEVSYLEILEFAGIVALMLILGYAALYFLQAAGRGFLFVLKEVPTLLASVLSAIMAALMGFSAYRLFEEAATYWPLF